MLYQHLRQILAVSFFWATATQGHTSSESHDTSSQHKATSLEALTPDTEVLDLSFKNLVGPFPDVICHHLNLQEVNLNGNKFTGNIPEEIQRLKNLKKLRLRENTLEAPLSLFSSFSKLTCLSIGSCRLPGHPPSEHEIRGKISDILPLASLKYLSLWSSGVTGPIPSQIHLLPRLKILSLGQCHLSGGIPQEIGLLSNLEWLYLQNCGLTGTIPDTVWKLTNLELLLFEGNRLSGTISSDIKYLTKLREIRFGENLFEGPFPDVLASFPLLETLDLHDCQKITGNIRFVVHKDFQTRYYPPLLALTGTSIDSLIIEDHRAPMDNPPENAFVVITKDPSLLPENIQLSALSSLGSSFSHGWTDHLDVSQITSPGDLWRLNGIYNANFYLTSTEETLFKDMNFFAVDTKNTMYSQYAPYRFRYDQQTNRRKVMPEDDMPLNEDQQRLQDILTMADGLQESKEALMRARGPQTSM